MNKIAILVIFLISFVVIQPAAGLVLVPDQNSSKQLENVEGKQLDERAQILAAYFKRYDSPLENHAQDFIDAADTFDMDWKLVPAIAGVESTFGKFIPGGHGAYTSYNAWGWGVYGDKSLGFESWRDGIFTVSKGLKTRYIDRGLTNPYSMNKVYAASPTWGTKVTHFLGDLDSFINLKSPDTKTKMEFETQIAASSAVTNFR